MERETRLTKRTFNLSSSLATSSSFLLSSSPLCSSSYLPSSSFAFLFPLGFWEPDGPAGAIPSALKISITGL